MNLVFAITYKYTVILKKPEDLKEVAALLANGDEAAAKRLAEVHHTHTEVKYGYEES